ncbi:hypothetical protein MSUIS_07120 [Mycoplasma suis KI3806]|uniref:Uncharacterized protein n=1 Tax=Mycoplasma suis (strain KI_3806) TaxID=708248 RepID=F0V2C4_MYCS3|nr:hypothetical protein MSUIS_07120 [Mycoplasma suis KI3806]
MTPQQRKPSIPSNNMERVLRTKPSKPNGHLIQEEDRVIEIYRNQWGGTCTETIPRDRREVITIFCY